jgi:putative acetyltransferase
MVSIREATSGDGPAILAVHRAAIRGIEPGTYAPAAIDAWVATQDDPSQYPLDDPTQYVAVATTDGDSVDATAREDRAVVTAREDSAVVGFVGLDLDRGVLETLYVSPAAGGDGVGAALLEHAEGVARRHDHDRLVAAASINAVGFYERHGYEQEPDTYTRDMDGHRIEFQSVEKPLRPDETGG